MELSQLVTTYEQSGKIGELLRDYKETIFSIHSSGWVVTESHDGAGCEDCMYGSLSPCWTAEELGEILPTMIQEDYQLSIYKGIDSQWYCGYVMDGIEGDQRKLLNGPTLSQAMGNMLIYLLENSLLPNNPK